MADDETVMVDPALVHRLMAELGVDHATAVMALMKIKVREAKEMAAAAEKKVADVSTQLVYKTLTRNAMHSQSIVFQTATESVAAGYGGVQVGRAATAADDAYFRDFAARDLMPEYPRLTHEQVAAVWRVLGSKSVLDQATALAAQDSNARLADPGTSPALLGALLNAIAGALGVDGRWMPQVPLYTTIGISVNNKDEAVPVRCVSEFAFIPAPHCAANVVTATSTAAVKHNAAVCSVDGLGEAVQHCSLRLLFVWQVRWNSGDPLPRHWWTYGVASDGFFLWLVKVSIEQPAGADGPQLVVRVTERLKL